MQIRRAGSSNFTGIEVDSSNLVWNSDRESFYADYQPVNHNTVPPIRGGQQLIKNISRDEHFMAWMRPSAHPSVLSCSFAQC
jgi:hypothetical protein